MISEGKCVLAGFSTWYRVVEPSKPSQARPLVLLHAGPGMDHRTLRSLEDLAESGRVVVLYDQLGAGRSAGPDRADQWTVQGFVDQLEALCAHLRLPQVDVLGHSWGGMLALLHALEHPDRVGRLVLHGAIACWNHCQQARQRWPWPTDSTDEGARQAFDEQYCCRRVPWPPDLRDAVRDMNATVAQVMWAPSEAHPRGLLADWDIRGRLAQLESPTLVLAGRHDAYTPGQAELFCAGIPSVRHVCFHNSAHYAHLEEPSRFRAEVVSFLEE